MVRSMTYLDYLKKKGCMVRSMEYLDYLKSGSRLHKLFWK
jgi:hypothetical protein